MRRKPGRKTTLKTIAIALVMTLMLAMTACGGNKDAALEKNISRPMRCRKWFRKPRTV